MEWWRFLLLLLLLAVPSFLQVMFTELSRDERQLTDAFILESLTKQIMNKESGSEITAAPGAHTACVFPENRTTFTTGNNYVLLVGLKNKGELPLWIHGFRAYVYHPNDHQDVVQDLKVRFAVAVVPPSFTVTSNYKFVISQYVKGGTYNLVGRISYTKDEDEQLFQNTFYNGTFEIAEAHDPVRVVYAIVTLALVLFCIVIAVCAYVGIKDGITKEVEKLQKIADRLKAN